MACTSEEIEERERLSKWSRQFDVVELDLYLLRPDEAARPGRPVFLCFPYKLQLPLLLGLLETRKGRAICANLACVRFSALPDQLRTRHEAQVVELYLVSNGITTPHLRFVLDDGAEVRYDGHSDPIEAIDEGQLVFKAEVDASTVAMVGRDQGAHHSGELLR